MLASLFRLLILKIFSFPERCCSLCSLVIMSRESENKPFFGSC